MLQNRTSSGRVARGGGCVVSLANMAAAFALAGRVSAFTAPAPCISVRGLVPAATTTGASHMYARARAKHVLGRTLMPLGSTFTSSYSSFSWSKRSLDSTIEPTFGGEMIQGRGGRGWNAAYTRHKGGGATVATMCSSAGAVGGELEVPADVAIFDAQIKAKGEVIRELKSGGIAKDALKPHIEVIGGQYGTVPYLHLEEMHPQQTPRCFYTLLSMGRVQPMKKRFWLFWVGMGWGEF